MKLWDVAGGWGRLNFYNSLRLRLCAKPSSAPTTAQQRWILWGRSSCYKGRNSSLCTWILASLRQEIRISAPQLHVFTTYATTVLWQARGSWGRGNNMNKQPRDTWDWTPQDYSTRFLRVGWWAVAETCSHFLWLSWAEVKNEQVERD